VTVCGVTVCGVTVRGVTVPANGALWIEQAFDNVARPDESG